MMTTTTEQLPLLSSVTLVCGPCNRVGDRQVLQPLHGYIHHTTVPGRDHSCVSWFKCPSCRTRYRVESEFVHENDRRIVRVYNRGPMEEDTWTLVRGNE